jgi:hypothetical protein
MTDEKQSSHLLLFTLHICGCTAHVYSNTEQAALTLFARMSRVSANVNVQGSEGYAKTTLVVVIEVSVCVIGNTIR